LGTKLTIPSWPLPSPRSTSLTQEIPHDCLCSKEFTFHNPDGSQIKVRGWGNQSAAVFETLDGYTVVQDPVSGFYHYATPSADGSDLVAAGNSRRGEAAPETLALPKGVRPYNRPLQLAAPVPGSILTGQRQWEVRRNMFSGR
jgi:hypothetical protein